MSESSAVIDPNSTIQRLRRGSVWIVIGRSLGMAIVFLNMVLLAKWLPKSEFSAHVVTISIVTLSSVAAMLGLNFMVCRLVAAYRGVGDTEKANKSVRLIFMIGATSSAVVAIAVGTGCHLFAERWFDRQPIANMAVWIGVWIFLLAISQIIAETYRGLHNLFAAALLAGVSGGLVSNALWFVGIVAFHASGQLDYTSVVMLGAGSFLVPVCVSLLFLALRWPSDQASKTLAHTPGQLVPPTPNSIIIQSLPIMFLNFIALGFDKAGQLTAGAFGSESNVALFEAMWLLAFLPMIPLTMLGLSISSTVSELFAKRQIASMQQIIKLASTISLIVTAPLLIILILFGGPVLGFTFGESFKTAAFPLSIFCLVQFVRNWMGPCDVVLVMTGKQIQAFCCFAISTPILLAGPWAVANHGLTGLTIVIAAAVLLSRTLQYIVIVKTLSISPHAELKPAFLSQLTDMIRGRLKLGMANNE